MVKGCYTPSKSGRFCWMQMMNKNKCKPGTFRSVHPPGRPDVVITVCRKKGGRGESTIQRKGKLKLDSGGCPKPACKRKVH